MYISTLDVCERLRIARDDVVRLFGMGVIERPTKTATGLCHWVIEDSPKLAELLSLTPSELRARGIVNTSLLYRKEN